MGEVTIKKQTTYKGKILNIGDKIFVQPRVEERWVRIGLAQYVSKFKKPEHIKSFEKSSLAVRIKKNKPTSIIIPARGCFHFLRNCIDSIVRHTNNYEIIVIDNDTPNTPIKKHVELLNDFDLTIITNKENMGFGYACNQGIKVAKYDYICFLNSDTLVTPNWLHELQRCFGVEDNISFVSPTTSYSRGEQCDKGLIKKAHIMTNIDIIEYMESLEKGFIQTEIYGFCMLAKKELFDKVGVFDYKRYGLGNCEENDLQWRARQLGYKSYWAKGAYVHHYGMETFKRFNIPTNIKLNESILEKRKKDKNLFIENDSIIDDIVKIDKPKYNKTIDGKKIGFIPHHNIHALCFRVSAGTRIRVLNIIRHLKNCVVSYNFDDLKDCDSVIFQAKWAAEDVELAKKLKECGVKLFFDTTDPHWDKNFDTSGKHKVAIEKILKYIDVMILPTERLKKSFLEYRQDKQVEVIPDSIVLSEHTGIKKHRKSNKYTIVWFGCRSNVCQIEEARADLEKLGKEFNLKLVAVYDKYFGIDIKSFDNLEFETIDWTEKVTIENILKSDLVINPKYEGWKNYKSNNKTIKALALGVPCVEEDFYKEIKKYLSSANLRNEEGKKGKEIAKKFDSKKIARKLVNLCDVKKLDLRPKKKSIAVVTAIMGGFDKLHEPKYYDSSVDYFAYVDEDFKSDNWNVKKIEHTHFIQPRMTSKIYKILIHKYCDYDYTLWIDGALEIRGSIGELVDKYMDKADMALFKHRMRNCVYEEHFASFKNKRHGTGEPSIVRENQSEAYKVEGLPAKAGLYECTFILRKNNAKVRKFNSEWWEEVCIYSSSDQIPFMYVLWKNPSIKVATITPGDNHDSKWAKYIEHVR